MERAVEFIRRHADFAAAAALFLVTLLFFLPGLGFDPIPLDNSSYVGKEYLLYFTWQNFLYHLKTPIMELYSPLVMHSFMLDYAVWGKDLLQAGGRLHNIILHSFSAVFFYMLLRKVKLVRFNPQRPFTISIAGALFGAICFALHAQRVESVIWVVERKDVQVIFLGLASSLLFIRSWQKGRLPIAGALLYLLSFGAKPLIITLPCVFVLGIWTANAEFNWKKTLKMLSPYLAVMLGYVIFNAVQLKSVAAGTASGIFSAARLEIVTVNYANYFFRTLLPVGIRPLYPLFKADLTTFLITAAFWAMVIFTVMMSIVKNRYRKLFICVLLPLLLAFMGVTLPVAGFKGIGNAEFADRYSYYPSIFVWIGMALTYEYFAPRRSIWQFAFWAYAVLMMILGFCYLQTWQSRESFINAALGDGKHVHPAVLRMAAWSCFERGEYDTALKFAGQALSMADDFRRKEDELFLLALEGTIGIIHGDDAGLALVDKVFSTPEWGRFQYSYRGFAESVMIIAANEHLRRGSKYDIWFATQIFEVLGKYFINSDRLKALNFMALAANCRQDFRRAEALTLEALQLSPGDQNLLNNLHVFRESIKNSPAKAASN